jgi:hypothetical protein
MDTCSITGPAGCSTSGYCCSCSTTYYPPAYVSGPSYSCTLPGNNGWCRGTGTLDVNAQEPMAPYVITGVEASFGMLCGGLNSNNVNCTWEFPEGSSSFLYWANSSYGDSSGQETAAMNVDSGIPALFDVFTPGAPGLRGWYQGGPVRLTCTADDLISGLDSLTFSGGAPFSGGVEATAEGTDTLTCTAEDYAGNISSASHAANIDSVAPTFEILYNGDPDPAGWSGALVHITMTAADATSGIYSYGFSVNGGPWENDLTLGDGYYDIVGRAEDNAGNVTQTAAVVGIDTTPPSTAWSLNSGKWVRGTVTLAGRSDDAGSGVAAVFISFDSGNWIRVGSDPDWAYTWDTTRTGDGPYMVLARAVDVAGNEEHTAELIINVDNTPPLVDMDEEWTVPSAGGAGGSDAASGIARARVTISGNGITPLVRDYGSVPGSIDWDGRDGGGARAGYGDYDATLEVWDRAGNYSVTYGVIHLRPPEAVPQPAQAEAVAVEPTQAPTEIPETTIPVTPKVELPLGIPFWTLALPLAGMGVWLSGSLTAFFRDGRWKELRALRKTLASYRERSKTNFTGGEEND